MDQGSMISLELFLSVINVLPNSLQTVETSLFADDSSLYKGRRSIKLLQTAVQQDLHALQQWCDKWGFKISTEKTVAVLFSQATQRPGTKLHINGSRLRQRNRLDFSELSAIHIDYVTSKCSKQLNLMRTTSSTRRQRLRSPSSIQSSRQICLRLQSNGVRQRINEPAPELDLIQYSALKLCCAAMTTTSTLVECGEAPLRLYNDYSIRSNSPSKWKQH